MQRMTQPLREGHSLTKVFGLHAGFKMYLGFCFHSGKMRPTDQEMTAIEKVVCYSQFPRRGAWPTT